MFSGKVNPSPKRRLAAALAGLVTQKPCSIINYNSFIFFLGALDGAITDPFIVNKKKRRRTRRKTQRRVRKKVRKEASVHKLPEKVFLFFSLVSDACEYFEYMTVVMMWMWSCGKGKSMQCVRVFVCVLMHMDSRRGPASKMPTHKLLSISIEW